jgi:hypothetical protein
VGGRRDDIQNELDMMSANSDVERELSMLRGELTADAPRQLEGGATNGSQNVQTQQTQQAPPSQQPRQAQQQTQPAGLPAEPQDGEGA